MTLPTDYIFPLPSSEEDPEKYIQILVNSLTDMYSDMADNINGYMADYTPTVTNVTTYGTQVAFYRRSGIMTQYWFDVTWTAQSGGGDVKIQLPYEVAESSGEPWVGVVESTSASNTFSGYLTLNADPGTYDCYIRDNVSTSASANLALANAGGFRGYIEYVGKEIESP